MKDIRGLSVEQRHLFRCAIERGYFDTWEDNPRSWKHTFVGAFLWKWPKRTKTLAIMETMLGHTPTWEDFDDDTIRDVVDEMESTGLSSSSIRTMCAELKSVLNENARRISASDFSKTLSVKGEASQHIYLNAEEVEKFLHYKPMTDAERYTHRNFCIELLTGARLCDAVKLTTRNCDINTGTLSYVPAKTPGVVVTVPVDEKRGLRKFLSVRSENDVCLSTYNEIARDICRRIGINEMRTVQKAGKQVSSEKWELVSSHTARRSFATNLYLAGVSLEDVAMMMGHGKNIDTTKRYICAERTISPSVMAYFRNEDYG